MNPRLLQYLKKLLPLFLPLVFLLVVFLIGYISIYFFGADNPIEESSEKFIKDKYGIIVEFSEEDKKQK